jgi:hypothetical protein
MQYDPLRYIALGMMRWYIVSRSVRMTFGFESSNLSISSFSVAFVRFPITKSTTCRVFAVKRISDPVFIPLTADVGP